VQNGDFVALSELGAMDAIVPYLLGECVLLNDAKTETLKKTRLIGQCENPWYSQSKSVRKGFPHEGRSDTLPLEPGRHSEGADLTEVETNRMQGSDPDKIIPFPSRPKIADMSCHFSEGSMQQQPLCGVKVEKLNDAFGVRGTCGADFHGVAYDRVTGPKFSAL
jgi:hypothetical protein